ncbi:MAG: hypothetical protein EHM16_13140, partial [Betaproteobacteria bacterium]
MEPRTQIKQLDQWTFALRRTAAATAVAACFSGAALANPTNPAIVRGAANITNPAANILNIQTLTPQT